MKEPPKKQRNFSIGYKFNTDRGTERTIKTLVLRRIKSNKLGVDKIEDFRALGLLTKEFLGEGKQYINDAELEVLQEGAAKRYGINTIVMEEPLIKESTKMIKGEQK